MWYAYCDNAVLELNGGVIKKELLEKRYTWKVQPNLLVFSGDCKNLPINVPQNQLLIRSKQTNRICERGQKNRRIDFLKATARESITA